MTQFQTQSPIDSSNYVTRDFATDAQLQDAIVKASGALQAWQQTTLAERKRFCESMLAYFVNHQDAIGEELCWQMGRPIRYAAGEVNGLIERARAMMTIADTALADIVLPEKSGFERRIKRVPHGVVAVLAPWNYPYLTAVNAIVPALLAGNVVILKHSVQTPLCAERFQAAFAEAGLPDGVFQALHLDHAQAKTLMQDGAVKYVAFTGSVEGGRRVEEALVGQFKTTGLELGGKDPAYVRADADLDHAIETVVDGAFFNSGQSCCGIERAYVDATVYERFVAGAQRLVEQYTLGRSDDPETTLGPLVNASAADFVRAQIDDAVKAGAKSLIDPTKFEMSQPGSAYLAPQLLVDVDHSMRVMTEESFGPVLGIQKVENDDEAIRLMNDSEYGLTAAIFTQDLSAGEALADRVETGTVFINRCDYLDPALAWTGIKNSGRGCTLSQVGFEQLTRPKSYHFKKID